jgi:hypothetical protein
MIKQKVFKAKLITTLILCCFFFVSSVRSQTPPEQVQALEDIYTNMNGEYWHKQENWLIGDPCENHWYGVNCDNNNVTFMFVFL